MSEILMWRIDVMILRKLKGQK